MSAAEAVTHREQQQACQCRSQSKTALKRLLANYHKSLVERPLATKSLTSALVSALGDIVASWRTGRHNPRRTLAFFLFGGCVTGPTFHYWYRMLERVCARHKGYSNLLAKLALERLIITPPFVAVTLFILRLLETGRTRQSYRALRINYLPTLKLNYKVWTIAQILNFALVPPIYRVLYGNVVALWWSWYLSNLNRLRHP